MANQKPNLSSTHSQHHVAVLAFPFGTHAGPLLTLVLRLAAAAPETTFSFITTSKANSSLFSPTSEASRFLNVKSYDVPDGLPEGFEPSGNPEQPVGFFLKAALANFRSAMKVAEVSAGVKTGCLVTDAFFWFAGEMSEEMNVPWIPLWTAGPRSLFVHVATDDIRQRILETSGNVVKTLEFLPGFSTVKVSDLPEGVVSGNLESPISTLLHKMGQKMPKAAAVVINSFEEAEPEVVNELKLRLKNCLNVGPFNLTAPAPPLLEDESGCLEWLDKQKPASVAYISFGSVVRPPPHELAVLAEALIEKGYPFLWSIRGNTDDILPKGCDKSRLNGKIVAWAPQVPVLEHAAVGVFVTHCGWNSTLESIVCGVPMICRPFFGDQTMNMRTVESVWGIGVGIEGGVLTKDGAIKALELILKGRKGNEMREKLRLLKNHAKSAVACDGSSTKSFNSLVEIVTKH